MKRFRQERVSQTVEEYPMEVRYKIWKSLAARYFVILLLSAVLLTGSFYQAFAAPRFQSSSDGKIIFELKCISCHSIGGGVVVGPDLEGVLDRRDRGWVLDFISKPDQVLGSEDPIAVALLAEFNNIQMPNMGLTETEVEALLVFLESGETVNQAIDAPLPEGNFNQGEAIFAGGQALENKGTPCIACHTVGTVGSFGGGNLGPDLTHVYGRFGKTGLTSAIQNISFPTMQSVYVDKDLTNQEVADLLEFFTAADSQGEEGLANSATTIFWVGGLMGAMVLFGVMASLQGETHEKLV
jgi:cytochrome c2